MSYGFFDAFLFQPLILGGFLFQLTVLHRWKSVLGDHFLFDKNLNDLQKWGHATCSGGKCITNSLSHGFCLHRNSKNLVDKGEIALAGQKTVLYQQQPRYRNPLVGRPKSLISVFLQSPRKHYFQKSYGPKKCKGRLYIKILSISILS